MLLNNTTILRLFAFWASMKRQRPCMMVFGTRPWWSENRPIARYPTDTIDVPLLQNESGADTGIAPQSSPSSALTCNLTVSLSRHLTTSIIDGCLRHFCSQPGWGLRERPKLGWRTMELAGAKMFRFRVLISCFPVTKKAKILKYFNDLTYSSTN